MTETLLPSWPNAYPETGAHDWLKLENADFRVDEIPQEIPTGEGEHV